MFCGLKLNFYRPISLAFRYGEIKSGHNPSCYIIAKKIEQKRKLLFYSFGLLLRLLLQAKPRGTYVILF